MSRGRRSLFTETIAALILRGKGHRILAQRYKTPVGDIDSVTLKGRLLAFIEVKRRKAGAEAAGMLAAKQRRRLVKAAQYWLAAHPEFSGYDIAFDLIRATRWCWPRYIANAFPV